MSRYRVDYMESERGWGQEYWSIEYDTLEEAEKAFNDANAWMLKNPPPPVPHIYTMAKKIVKID